MHRRRGQATAEFALMLPLVLALLFLCVEFALFAGVIHWDTYAAFAMARSVQAGGDAEGTGRLLLDGRLTGLATASPGWDRARVRQPWRPDAPGVVGILGDLDSELTVVLGPDEYRYEGRAHPPLTDNNGGG